MSEYRTISEIPYSSERAVIVNVHTLLCTTLAILSTRRYMDMPLLVIDSPLHLWLVDLAYLANKYIIGEFID